MSLAAVPLSRLPAGTPLKDFARVGAAPAPAPVRPCWQSTLLGGGCGAEGAAARAVLELSAIQASPAEVPPLHPGRAGPKRKAVEAAPGESPAKTFWRLKARAAALAKRRGRAEAAADCLLLTPARLAAPGRRDHRGGGELRGEHEERRPEEAEALDPAVIKEDLCSLATEPLVLESPHKVFLHIKQKLQEKPLLKRGDAPQFQAAPNAPPSPTAKQPLPVPKQPRDLHGEGPSADVSQDGEFLVEPAELDNETFHMALNVTDISYDPVKPEEPLENMAPGSSLPEGRGNQKEKQALQPVSQKPSQQLCDIIFATPRVHIPRKQKAAGGVSKESLSIPGTEARNDANSEDPQMIYLSEWRIKVINYNTAVCLEGKRRDMKDIYWHSNAIAERLAPNQIKTVSGNVYVLEGRIDAAAMKKEGMSSTFIKRFGSGIPRNWKKYVDDLLHNLSRKEQKRFPSSEGSNEPEDPLEAEDLEEQQDLSKTSQRKLRARNTTYEVLVRENNQPGTQNDQDTSLTRSGRRVKPPMQFWCGERILIDQALNVTVTKGGTNYLSPTVSSVQPRDFISKKKNKASDSKGREEVLLSCTRDAKESDHEIDIDEVCRKQAVVALTPLNHKKLCEINLKFNKQQEREGKMSQRGRKCSDSKTCLNEAPLSSKYPLRSQKQVSQSDQITKSCQGSNEDESSDDIPTIKRKTQSSFRRKVFSGELHCARRQLSELRGTENSADPFVLKNKISTSHWAEEPTDKNSSLDLVTSSGRERRNGKQSLRKIHRVIKDTLESESESETGIEEFQLGKGKKRITATGMDGHISSHVKATVVAEKEPAVWNAKDSAPDGHEAWTDEELHLLRRAMAAFPKHKNGFWLDVAEMVGTRSAEECQQQYMVEQEGRRRRAQKTTKSRKQEGRGEGTKKPAAVVAKVGTLKRKQQMRLFLEQMPKDNHDDVFAATPFQSRSTKLPQFHTVPDEDVFQLKDSRPITPSSAIFPLVKTPQCDHVSPGMLQFPDREDCEKHVFHMQKNIKGKERTWKNVKKKPARTVFATPTSRRTNALAFGAALGSPGAGGLFRGNPRDQQREEEEDEEEDAYFST